MDIGPNTRVFKLSSYVIIIKKKCYKVSLKEGMTDYYIFKPLNYST